MAYASTSSDKHNRQIQRSGAVRASSSSAHVRLRSRTDSGSPVTSLLRNESDVDDSQDPKHIAISHEDTSSGAVHCFQDQYGQWYSYTFGDAGAQPLPRSFVPDQGMQVSGNSRGAHADQGLQV